MSIDPIKSLARENQNLKNEDILILLLDNADYYIYVEDKGNGGLYQQLCKKIYTNKVVKIFDDCDGKSAVIKRYKDLKKANQLSKKTIFLLDRDYENKFENRKDSKLMDFSFRELKNNSYFRIWEKTNIENYFLDRSLIIDACSMLTLKTSEVFTSILSEESYNQIIKHHEKCSYLYMINNFFCCGSFPKGSFYMDLNTLNTENLFFSNFDKLKIEIFENHKKYILDLPKIDKPKCFGSITSSLRYKYDSKIDIDGKDVFNYIVKYINKSIKQKMSSQNLKGPIINLLSQKKIEEIQKELRLS
jgi:hypothetical protein